MRGPLGGRNFRFLFAGQAISAFGDRIAPVALAFAVLSVDKSPSALGLVLAAQTAPLALFVLFGGVVADRLSRRWVMLASDLARFALQAATAAILLVDDARLWELIVLQALFGAATAFFSPAVTGLVPETVQPQDLQQANAVLGLAHNLTMIAGPAAAGVVVAFVGPAAALAADAGTFLVSTASLSLLRLPHTRPAERSLVDDLRLGWSEFSRRRWLWVSVAHFSCWHVAVLAPLFVLGPVVAQRSLGGAGSWAVIMSALGAGATVGGVAALRIRPARPLRTVFVLAAVCWPAQFVLLARAAPTAAIAASAFAAGAEMSFFSAVWTTTLQRNVPSEAVSRVSAYDWMGTYLFMPLGYALVGPLAHLVGVPGVLWAAAAWAVGSSLLVLVVRDVRSQTFTAGQFPPDESPPARTAQPALERPVDVLKR